MDGVMSWAEVVKAYAPAAVQLIATIGVIVTAVINNRKKTQESIDSLKEDFAKANNETNEKVDALSSQFAAHVREDEDNNAKQVRVRILRFYDELCEGKTRSESHYDDILDDIDYYEKFVSSHADFRNNRGEAAMNYIRDRYRIEKETGGFLKHY